MTTSNYDLAVTDDEIKALQADQREIDELREQIKNAETRRNDRIRRFYNTRGPHERHGIVTEIAKVVKLHRTRVSTIVHPPH